MSKGDPPPTSGLDPMEMQEGVVGLLRALERYDPELGVPFWAYLSAWVRQAMQQLVRELGRPALVLVLCERVGDQLAERAERAASRLDHGKTGRSLGPLEPPLQTVICPAGRWSNRPRGPYLSTGGGTLAADMSLMLL